MVEHYTEIQEALARRGRRVVCFDMPGFGFSEPRGAYDYGVVHGGEIVVGLLEALDVPRATLVFTCANGFYALAAARRAPERIARLILLQTPSADAMRLWADRHVPRIMRVPVLGQAFMRLVRQPAAHVWYRQAVAAGHDPRPLQQVARRAISEGGAYRLADMVQGLADTRSEDLDGVGAPTTIVWGEADRSHPERPAESLRRHVPQADVVRFPECGHFPDLEAPERYVELVLSLTEGVASGAV